jgi:putative spermidine/putrescine transport system substrate-binding protein
VTHRRAVLAGGLASLAAPAILRAQGGLSGTVTLLAYGGIFQDIYARTVVAPFEAAHPGVKVTYVGGGTSAQMVGTLRVQRADPQADVAIMDVTTSTLGNAEGLFDKLTTAEFPVLDELDPRARAAGGDYGPAVTFDHLVLVSDEAGLKPPVERLADLWRPELKGQVALAAPPNIQGLCLTIMTEAMEGGDWRRSIDAAIRKLKALAPSVSTFEPSPDGYSLVLGGVAKATTGWNARAQLYRNDNPGKLAVLLPPEGSVFQINTVNLVAGSKNRAAAAAFVAHALSQPAQKAFTERMFYAPVNAKARIEPAALARTAAAPENRARMIPVEWADVLKVRDQWNNRWRREVLPAAR